MPAAYTASIIFGGIDVVLFSFACRLSSRIGAVGKDKTVAENKTKKKKERSETKAAKYIAQLILLLHYNNNDRSRAADIRGAAHAGAHVPERKVLYTTQMLCNFKKNR